MHASHKFVQLVVTEDRQHIFGHLTLNSRAKISAEDILKYFSFFSQKTGFGISEKIPPKETICMKCQNLFQKKIFLRKYCLLNFPREW